MDDWQRALITDERVARLATVDATGQPHVVPIVFAYDGRRLFTPLDGKPKRVRDDRLRRVRNIAHDDRVAVVVDRYADDWGQLAWVQLRGRAQVLTGGADYDAGIRLLAEKYPQYASVALHGRPLICIAVEQIRGWRAQPDA